MTCISGFWAVLSYGVSVCTLKKAPFVGRLKKVTILWIFAVWGVFVRLCRTTTYTVYTRLPFTESSAPKFFSSFLYLLRAREAFCRRVVTLPTFTPYPESCNVDDMYIFIPPLEYKLSHPDNLQRPLF